MLAALIFVVTFGSIFTVLCLVATKAGLLVSSETNYGWIGMLSIIWIVSAASTVMLKELAIEKWGWTFLRVDVAVPTIDCPMELWFGEPPPNSLPRIDGC